MGHRRGAAMQSAGLAGVLTIALMMAVPASEAEALAPDPAVVCGAHVPEENCAAGKELVRWVLQRNGARVENWRWVLVARDDWRALTTFYRVPERVPGFTNLPTHTTYLEDVTYALD